MRWERNLRRGSRPDSLPSHPRPTKHTAASYHAKYLEGGNASLNRLLRHARMVRSELVAT